MAAPTVAVTVKLSDILGAVIEGATVRAKLDRYEVYQQFVVADDTTGTTDENGECVLDLFPNAKPTNDPAGLGSQGSIYIFTITGTGGKTVKVQAVIPNQACDLHDVITAEEPGAPSTGEIVGAVRYNIAQSLDGGQQTQARENIGFDAAAAAAAPVQSVAGRTGAVTLAKADVGLASADDTSDADKPVSTATQTALDGKATLAGSAAQDFATKNLAVIGTISMNGTVAMISDASRANHFFGRAGNTSVTGSGNTGGGDLALNSATTAVDCTALGSGALQAMLSGVGGTAVGRLSQRYTTVGNSTSIGDSSLAANTTGAGLFAGGYQTLSKNTTGSYSSGGGAGALQNNTIGDHGSAWGHDVLYSNTVGSRNSGGGAAALYSNVSADDSSAWGYASFFQSTGRRQTGAGAYSGFGITTGEGNTFIGYDCGNTSQVATVNRSFAIGIGAYTTIDDQAVIGGSNIVQTILRGRVLLGTMTDDGSTRLQVAGNAAVSRLIAGSGPANALIMAHSTGEYTLGLAGATKALRVVHDTVRTSIDGVDPTLSGSYQPLGLNGSELTFSIAGTPVMEIPAAGTGVSVTGAVSATTRFNLPSFTVGTLPAVGAAAGFIYVSNETGGAVPAFSDGTNWRRVTDRAIVA